MAMNGAAHAHHRLAIFNHKGGVGKTTLTVNIGSALAEIGYRVLLVDTDPQCNMTSYLVDSEVVDDLLDRSDDPNGQTIWSAVKPISEALGTVGQIKPLSMPTNNLFLVPGDIRLSEFESDLNDFWAQCLQRKPRGFRGTTAISDVVDHLVDSLDIDYVLYDSGPNIGPLNRVVLLDCDAFLVPVACDLFSLRALKTLGRTLYDWVSNWSTIADLAPADMGVLEGQPKLLGYIPQGFRTYGGAVTQQHAYFLQQIEKEVGTQVVNVLRQLDPDLAPRWRTMKLGELKNFGSLVPSSQRAGRPIYEAEAGTQAQRDSAGRALFALARRIDQRSQRFPR